LDSLWSSGDRETAASLLRTELPRARAAGDSVLVSHLLVRQGVFAIARGESREADTALREGVAMARARRDSTLLISGVRWLSVAVGGLGLGDEAFALYEELLDLGLALDDRRHQGWAHIGMAWAFWRQGESERALNAYREAASLFAGTGDAEGELWANNGIAT
jgi:tetratricopeptide (TPR) repeat protein